MTDALPHLIVVGGGAGGLELVTRMGKTLGRKKHAKITLIDANLTHLWKPLLHEVAAGTMNAAQNEVSYLNHSSKHNYQFMPGKVIALDRQQKYITISAFEKDKQPILSQRTVHYDYLVFAVGSQCNDFAIPGVAEFCTYLETRWQAEVFHQQLLQTMLARQEQKNPVNIAIVGAGATGVELAAELQYTLSHMHHYGLPELKKENLSISLIEAGPRILAALPERVALATSKELELLGVKIYCNERVAKVTGDGLYTANDEFIPASLKVWAAGIKAPQFLAELDGLACNKINQLIVKQNLQTTHDDCIFAIGDCAEIPQENNPVPVPALAQAAHQEAICLSKSFTNILQNKPLINFTFHHRGSLISLSHYSSIGYLMGRLPGRLHLEGKIARFLYLMLYKVHQRTLFGFWKTFIQTIANLLTKGIRPRLKLH